MTGISLRAIIIDDEPESLQLLGQLLSGQRYVRVTGSTSDPDQAASLIMSSRPDILFLDVKMPGKSGFDVLDELSREQIPVPYIVFTTAYDEFAIRAFDYSAFDYLLKPIIPERLSATIERCIRSQKGSQVQRTRNLLELRNKLVFRNISGMIIIDPSDVVFIEAEGNYSVFTLTKGKTETVTCQIGKIEMQLPADKFHRISKTYIVNLAFLKKIVVRKRECTLQCDEREYTCQMSQEAIKDLFTSFNNSLRPR